MYKLPSFIIILSISYRSTYCNQTINYNNQTIWILKLSLFSQFNSSQSPGRPQLTRHWIQVFLLKKDLPKPCTPPSPQAPPAGNFLLLSAPLLACRMVEGGGTSFLLISSFPHYPPHLLYCVLSTLNPPISFLLFMMAAP